MSKKKPASKTAGKTKKKPVKPTPTQKKKTATRKPKRKIKAGGRPAPSTRRGARRVSAVRPTMVRRPSPARRREVAGAEAIGPSYSSSEVFRKLCYEVYPPCRKQPADIRPHHKLDDDLGYVGSSKNLLAPKTNQAFGLTPPNYFIGSDFDDIETVRDHHEATSEKLENTGRLKP